MNELVGPGGIPSQIVNSFFVIMVISAVVAIFLAQLARKKGQITRGELPTATNVTGNLPSALAQQIGKLSLPQHQQNQITRAVSELFDQTLNSELTAKTVEISQKYQNIIQEKEKAVQFVEKQYMAVSEKYESLNKNFKTMGVEKKQTEEIVRSMAEGVIMVNQKGDVLLMNPAAERLLGVKKEDKIGKSIMGGVKEDQLVSLALDTGKEEREVILESQNDQTKRVVKASNAVIESEDGKTLGFVSVLSDITKQKELDELKSAFVSSVSHELRTPLNNVQESLKLVLDRVSGEINPQQDKILNIGLNNIQRLTRLINDLLDLSKLEAKQFNLNASAFDLNVLVNNTVDSFAAWAKTKQITIENKTDETIQVEADQDKLTQVLTNLTGNALKFTPPGGKVTILARKKPGAGSSQGELIEVGVQDTGPGIAKKDLAKLFQKFVQLNTPSLQGISGTGLGLAISKEIVELHKGRIWAESEEGKGSKFLFEIPAKNGAAHAS
jgi:two-component system sensor histidine kinase VicK